jgi:hypothetical protein
VRAAKAAGKYGWDAPLTLEIKADAAALAAAFSEAAPAGRHSHDTILDGVYRAKTRKNQTDFPRGRTNRLKEWFRHIPNWQMVYKQGSLLRASISVFLAYAQIIDKGGPVPGTFANNLAMCMAFRAGGQDVHAKYRRGYQIRGQGYINKGLQNFTELRGSTGLRVGWRPSTNANK